MIVVKASVDHKIKRKTGKNLKLTMFPTLFKSSRKFLYSKIYIFKEKRKMGSKNYYQ